MTLYIRAHSPEVRELLSKHLETHRWTDSGFDIPMVAQTVMYHKDQHSFNLGISVAAVQNAVHGSVLVEEPRPCLLLPRSSIYKTPFRLTNSIGLIDQGYRGEIMAKVDILDWNNRAEPEYSRYDSGTRFFQICQHNFLPWESVRLVDTLPEAKDNRGTGGFGSTDKNLLEVGRGY